MSERTDNKFVVCSYNIIKLYSILGFVVLLIGGYIFSIVSARYTSTGIMFLGVIAIGLLQYGINRNQKTVYLETDGLRVGEEVIELNSIVSYNLFKYCLQKYSVLELKRKDGSNLVLFSTSNELEKIKNYFMTNKTLIPTTHKVSYINVHFLIFFFVFMMILALIV